MAILSTTRPTLLDITRRKDPDGSIAAIAELMSETNEIIPDIAWMEANNGTGHKSTQRTGLPTPTWRKLNAGVAPTKTTTAQVEDTTACLEAFSEIDAELADLNGNTAAFRLSEDRGHLEAMAQEGVDTLFYGIEGSEPEAFSGLSVRYNDTSATNGKNIIQNGTTPDTSIWLIGWDADKIAGIYPQGTTAGLQMQDLGLDVIEDASDGSNTGRMMAYRTHYKWRWGLHIRDWRYAVRIQVDESELVKDAATGPDLPTLMNEALSLIPNRRNARFAWYVNASGLFWIQQQAINAVSNSTLRVDMLDGMQVMSYGGFPLRKCDALRNDENTSAPIS